MENFFLKKQFLIHFLCIGALFIFCLFSTWINYIPKDYIVATGDKHFPADIKDSYLRHFYVWGHFAGAGYITPGNVAELLHNGFFYFLDSLGYPDNQKQNIKYFLFFFLSALSAYFGLSIFFKEKASPLSHFLVAFFYAFNYFTLDAVVTIGVYGTYFDLYIFLPLIWCCFARGLLSRKKLFLVLSGIFVLLSAGGVANPAFLMVLLSLLGCTSFLFWAFKLVKPKWALLYTLFSFLFYVFILSFFLLPYLFFFFSNSVVNQASDIEQLKEWIKWMSVSVSNLFNLGRYRLEFPHSFFYQNWFFKKIFIVLFYYPAFIISLNFLLLTYRRQQSRRERRILMIFSILFLIFIFFNAKTKLSENISLFIFSLPLLSALRSADKFIILFPFFVSLFLYYILEGVVRYLSSRRLQIVVYSLFLGISFFYASLFFIGKFHKELSVNYVWNFRFDTMVRMPSYYKELANYINQDKDYFKVLMMPFGGQIGAGWVLYPRWKYIGVDFTNLYIDKPVFSAINDQLQYFYGEYFYKHPTQLKDIFIKSLQQRGIRYVIFNNDVDDIYKEPIRNIFNSIRELSFVRSFGRLDLYRIDKKVEVPVIFILNQDYRIQGSMFKDCFVNYYCYEELIERQKKSNMFGDRDNLLLSSLKEVSLSFQRVSPVKYIVEIKGARSPFWLVFSDTFHQGWRLYKDNNDSGSSFLSEIRYLWVRPLPVSHQRIFNYANAWYIDPGQISGDDSHIILYFRPQLVLYLGLLISVLTFFISLVYLGYSYYFYHKRTR